MNKIKFASRPNMKYLVHLIIWSFIRHILVDIISEFLHFDLYLIYSFLMFLGEFIFGLILYLYQKKYFLKKNNVENAKFMGIELISNIRFQINDSKYKILFLIIFTSFFDFLEISIVIELGTKIKKCSRTIDDRLGGTLIIFESIIYRYVLKLPIFRHQIFSILIIFMCLIITIATEFYYQDISIFLPKGKFVLFMALLCINQFFNSLLDLIEKYLFEYDYFNPFKMLLLEGFVGLFFSLSYYFYKSPISYFIKYYNQHQDKLPYLIICLVLYIILSGIENTFRIVVNKIYSPMAATVSEYILNPIYIICSLFLNDDFISNRKTNYFYFAINLFLSAIISFSACIYNEFVILFFCRLQHETYQQISYRANSIYNRRHKLFIDEDDYDTDNSTL